MALSSRPASPHGDPGMQPERTSLAWGRTMLALVTVSAIFLRWLPVHGLFILLLFALSTASALTIYLTQGGRYRSSSRGILQEKVTPNVTSVLWTALAGMTLGGLGLATVLAG